MDAFKVGYDKFRDLALRTGFTKKVVGDYSYRKPRRKKGKFQYIKLDHVNPETGAIGIRWFEQ